MFSSIKKKQEYKLYLVITVFHIYALNQTARLLVENVLPFNYTQIDCLEGRAFINWKTGLVEVRDGRADA